MSLPLSQVGRWRQSRVGDEEGPAQSQEQTGPTAASPPGLLCGARQARSAVQCCLFITQPGIERDKTTARKAKACPRGCAVLPGSKAWPSVAE